MPRYAEAATLRWLDDARERLWFSAAGRYRIFLIALTDLPIGAGGGRAPRYNDQTLMDGPDLPVTTLPSTRPVSEQFHVGVYVYEYASDSPDGYGVFMSQDETLAAHEHVEHAGLSRLGPSTSIP